MTGSIRLRETSSRRWRPKRKAGTNGHASPPSRPPKQLHPGRGFYDLHGERGQRQRGQLPALAVSNTTNFVDKGSGMPVSPSGLANIKMNDDIGACGYVDASASSAVGFVTRIVRLAPLPGALLAGPLSAMSASSMTIFGDTVDLSAATTFGDSDGNPVGDQTAFLALITPGTTRAGAIGTWNSVHPPCPPPRRRSGKSSNSGKVDSACDGALARGGNQPHVLDRDAALRLPRAHVGSPSTPDPQEACGGRAIPSKNLPRNPLCGARGFPPGPVRLQYAQVP